MVTQAMPANRFELNLDFTSALYLGFNHASADLPHWSQLTTGRPEVLQTPPGSRSLARALAKLVGCEAAIIGRSTLHLFMDLFALLAVKSAAIYIDAGAYPVMRWTSERALLRKVTVQPFPHHDADALERLVCRDSRDRKRPVVVTDALCTECARAAPLRDYLSIVRRFGGLLVFDDTQGLGILGHRSHSGVPYGCGGGGSWKWHDLNGEDIVSVTSLAKGFGAPVAALCGSKGFVRRFSRSSETRIHCSAPSVPTLLAGSHALRQNHLYGDGRRFRLAVLVRRFQNRLAEVGLETFGGLLPMQTLKSPIDREAVERYRNLSRLGVSTVLRRLGHDGSLHITFVITARHRFNDIDHGVAGLAYSSRGTHGFRRLSDVMTSGRPFAW